MKENPQRKCCSPSKQDLRFAKIFQIKRISIKKWNLNMIQTSYKSIKDLQRYQLFLVWSDLKKLNSSFAWPKNFFYADEMYLIKEWCIIVSLKKNSAHVSIINLDVTVGISLQNDKVLSKTFCQIWATLFCRVPWLLVAGFSAKNELQMTALCGCVTKTEKIIRKTEFFQDNM